MMLRKVMLGYRKFNGIPLRVLSKDIGISLMTLNRFERGKAVKDTVVMKIMKYLIW